jgi:hypothetical protein
VDSAGIITRSALVGDPAFTHGSERLDAALVSTDPDEHEQDHHADHDSRTEPEHALILPPVGSGGKVDDADTIVVGADELTAATARAFPPNPIIGGKAAQLPMKYSISSARFWRDLLMS